MCYTCNMICWWPLTTLHILTYPGHSQIDIPLQIYLHSNVNLERGRTMSAADWIKLLILDSLNNHIYKGKQQITKPIIIIFLMLNVSVYP